MEIITSSFGRLFSGQEMNFKGNTMINKASIRRFLWRHFPGVHHMLYTNDLTQEEIRELLVYVDDKQKAQKH